MRTILAALFMVACAPALAGWEAVAVSADNDFYFADPSTIRKNNGFRRIWTLKNYHEGQSGILSMRSMDEFDCKEERYRNLTTSFHSEPFGRGKTLIANNAKTEWQYIAPGTTGADMLRYVCDKK